VRLYIFSLIMFVGQVLFDFQPFGYR